MSIGSAAVQSIVYQALSGALSCPVYDEPPETPGFPYVTIGGAVETPRNTFTSAGREIIAQVDVWSRSGPDAAQDGFGEALGIAGMIDVLLDDYEPAPTLGWATVSFAFDQAQPLRDPDGITRHLMLQYRVRLEAA